MNMGYRGYGRFGKSTDTSIPRQHLKTLFDTASVALEQWESIGHERTEEQIEALEWAQNELLKTMPETENV